MRQSVRRILFTFLLLVLLEGLSMARAETIAFSVTLGTPSLGTNPDGSTRVDLAGYSLAGAVGNPPLPFREVDVLLPPDADPASLSLTVTKADTQTLPGTHVLLPQAASSESGAAAVPALTRNAAVFGRDALFPQAPAGLLRSSRMRKWRFARVAVQPVQYNPVAGTLVATTCLDLELSYKRTGSKLTPAEARDTVMEDEAATRFVNYQTGKDWYAPARETPGAADPEGRHDYVIITTKTIHETSTALRSFLASLVRRGHTPYVKEVEDIVAQVSNEPAPHKRAEKIRQWLMDHFQAMGIAYVLLIGDPSPCHDDPSPNPAYPDDSCNEGHVPMKMTWPMHYSNEANEANATDASEKAIAPTDAYYAVLHGNWDANGDGYFGDPPDPDKPDDAGDFVEGGLDFTADVKVGRIPVYNSDIVSLDAILRKIVAYREARASDIAWRKSALLAMSFTFDEHTKYVDGAALGEQMQDDFLAPAGYSTWRMYQSENDANNLCHDISAYAPLADENLVGGNTVQQRWTSHPTGIVTWWGHGSKDQVVVGAKGCWHTEDGSKDYLMASTLAPGLDDSHPAFTYQCACWNGWPEEPGNLQYALLQNGAVATVAATRESWAEQVAPGHFNGTAYNTGLGYEYLSRITRNLPAGAALTQAKAAVVGWAESQTNPSVKFKGFMNLLEFNLYGDPSLSLADNASQARYPSVGSNMLLLDQ